ncbi:protein NDR1-like [Chenopodium quinoa]|uniref:protein NDR1-like n=1 Tax=Chenopodium quinoa TaxID=63459 RepID=UPI000B76EF0D|nr:protein NDR1-like [Chenopodium quinoa]
MEIGRGSIGSFIFISIIVLLYFYFNRRIIPICSIEEFTVFALQEKPTNSTLQTNNTIHFDLKVKNKKSILLGIYYDALKLTFFYKRNIHSFPIEIGDANFRPFFLRNSKSHSMSTNRTGSIDVRGVKWENDTVVSSQVVFRVELLTKYRYKRLLWTSGRYHLLVGADLEVNNEGSLVNNKGVKLKSKAGRNSNVRFELMGILGILIFILSR